MVRPWLYVTRNHGDGNPVTRVMGDSISRVMGNPITMGDPGIRVAGGTAYGGIYMGVIWLYRPTRAAVNMARGVVVRELYGLTHRLHLFTHRHCISLYIPIMYPKFQNHQKMQKFTKPKSFFLKKIACSQQDIYVY